MTMMSVTNELLLVAAVTWDLVVGVGGVAISKRSKVKVYDSDLVKKGSSLLTTPDDEEGSLEAVVAKVVTGRDFIRLIKKQLHLILRDEQGNIENKDEDPSGGEEGDSSLRIEVYDTVSSTYVNLLDDNEISREDEDIIQRFGRNRRLRTTVCYHPKSKKQDESSGSHDRQLPAITGRYYPYDASEGIKIAGRRIVIKEIANQENAGTGVNVWDGALLLARYLEKQPSLVQNKRILELGAGCGLVGIAAGVLGAKDVIVTDLPYALPNMQTNIDSYYEGCCETNNESVVPRILCHPLDWYDHENLPTWKQFASIISRNRNSCNATKNDQEMQQDDEWWIPDLVLVADCVWMQELVEPLLNTIQKLMERAMANSSTTTTITIPKVLISYQRRGKSTHEEFWNGIHNITVDPNTATLAMKVTEIDVTTVGLTKPDVLHLLLLEANC